MSVRVASFTASITPSGLPTSRPTSTPHMIGDSNALRRLSVLTLMPELASAKTGTMR